MNLRSFNLYHDYSNSFTLSNASELFLSGIPKNHIQVQKEKENLAVACVCPPGIRLPQHVILDLFPSQSCSDGKEMYKTRDARAELLSCLFNLLLV